MTAVDEAEVGSRLVEAEEFLEALRELAELRMAGAESVGLAGAQPGLDVVDDAGSIRRSFPPGQPRLGLACRPGGRGCREQRVTASGAHALLVLVPSKPEPHWASSNSTLSSALAAARPCWLRSPGMTA